MKMEKQAMLMGIRISNIHINNFHIDPSTRQGIGLNDNPRFSFQTNVPGFGFGYYIDSMFDKAD